MQPSSQTLTSMAGTLQLSTHADEFSQNLLCVLVNDGAMARNNHVPPLAKHARHCILVRCCT